MATTIRLSGFPAKTTPVLADIVYIGDSGAAFDEVQSTIAQVINTYPNLTGIGGLTLGAGSYAYVNAASVFTAGTITPLAISLLADASTGTMQTTLGLVIGTNVQAHSVALDSIAGLTTIANNLIYTTASNTYAVIAPSNNSVLITGSGGIPSLSAVLPAGLTTTDPSVAQGLATKNYVDQNAKTGTQVYAASTGALTVTQSGAGVGATLTNAGAQATFALDGVNPPIGSNVVIKDQSGGANTQNGIYTVTNVGSGATNWVLTRATTYDTPTDINNTGLIVIVNGSTLAGSAWYNTVIMVTVDTTAITYAQFGQNLSAATKAQQEAASSNAVFVTPAVQQYHPSAVQANIYGTVSGSSVTTVSSYNISSVTYSSTGVYSINLSVAFSGSYAATGSITPPGGPSGSTVVSYGLSNIRQNSSSNIIFYSANGTAQADYTGFAVMASGAQ